MVWWAAISIVVLLGELSDAADEFVLKSQFASCRASRLHLQLMWIQQNSGCMNDVIMSLDFDVPEFLESLHTIFPEYSLGIASFVDKPVEPFGQPAVDYCYRVHIPLTPWHDLDPNHIFFELNMLLPGSGRDLKENHLGALLEAIDGTAWASMNEANETYPPAVKPLRVVMLLANSASHEAGDFTGSFKHPGTSGSSCLENDYPSVEQVLEAMERSAVHVVVVGLSSVATQSLQNFGITRHVFQVESPPSPRFIEGLSAALDSVCSFVTNFEDFGAVRI